MDDDTDRALYKIERDIARDRALEPCEDYERASIIIPFCRSCGWVHEQRESCMHGAPISGECAKCSEMAKQATGRLIMEDQRSIVAEALEKYAQPARTPWAAIVVGLSAIYLLARFTPWAIHGLKIKH